MSDERNNRLTQLERLVKAIKADGVLDIQEIRLLKEEILADQSVSDEEAVKIFELENLLRNKETSEEFQSLFVNGLTSYLLYTGTSPGELDIKELIWLQDRISSDYKYSSLERTLLLNLVNRAEKLPDNFLSWVNDMEKHINGSIEKTELSLQEANTNFLDELKKVLNKFSS